MQFITFSQLRTDAKKLKKALEEGKTIELVHRSRVVAEIKPKIYDPQPFDPKKFLEAREKINLEYLSDEEIEKRYRKHLEEKYGKSIS